MINLLLLIQIKMANVLHLFLLSVIVELVVG